jgi:hypothetical protein
MFTNRGWALPSPWSLQLILFVASFGTWSRAVLADPPAEVPYPTGVTEFNAVQALNAEILRLIGISAKQSGGKKDPDLILNLEPLLEKRRLKMHALLDGTPPATAAFFLAGFSQSQQNAIPAPLHTYLEREVTLQGLLEVTYHDDFDHPEESHYSYVLRTPTERVALFPSDDLGLLSESEIQVSGLRLGDRIVVDLSDSDNLSVLYSQPIIDSTGNQRTLVLLLEFTDSPEELEEGNPIPIWLQSQEAMREAIFDEVFDGFFAEQSYGNVSFSGDVSGWHLLQRVSSFDGSGLCTPPIILEGPNNDWLDVVAANNIDLTQYDRMVTIVNCNGATPRSNSSLGKIPINVNGTLHPLSRAWIYVTPGSRHRAAGSPVTYLQGILIHEMGHSLGVAHAGSIHCGDNVFSGRCHRTE